MGLELSDITLRRGSEVWIDDVSLSLDGGISVLLGPTLAGKTTLMRIMAGLVRPDSGTIRVNGQDVTGTNARQRSVAMVYQQFINYPSMNVFDNIASPLTLVKGMSAAQIRSRVEEVAEMLQIAPLLDRRPDELSGGQQQRTAIARALAREADVLLLDEPLANLDYKLRESLRADLKRIFDGTQMIVLYSTAEAGEALDFAAPTAVLGEGRLHQIDHALDVYHRPADVHVAHAISDPPINLLTADVADGRLSIAGVTTDLPQHMEGSPTRIVVGAQPHRLRLGEAAGDELQLDAVVRIAELTGGITFVHVLVGDDHLVVAVDGTHPAHPGEPVRIAVNPRHLHVFDISSGALLSAAPGTVLTHG